MSQMPSRQSAIVNGLDLAYYEWGTSGAPIMICLHSHTNNAASWREFAEYASDGYHVFALDQRGHGNSEWASDGYKRDKFVEDLAGFIIGKGFRKVTLVGCSMGGLHSILYAYSNPDVVSRIIMVDIAPEPSPERLGAPPPPPVPMEFDSLNMGFEWLRTGNGLASDKRLLEEAKTRLKETENGKWIWKADLEGFDNPLPDMTSSELIGRYWSAIEAIACPILEIRGSESGLVSDETIQKMKDLGNDVSSVDVEGAGHVVMVDKPEAFIDATKGFI